MGLWISAGEWPHYLFDRELCEIEKVDESFITLEERLKLLREWPETVSIGYSVIHVLRRIAFYLETGRFYAMTELDAFYKDAEKNSIKYRSFIIFSDSEGWYLPFDHWDLCWNGAQSCSSAVTLWKELAEFRRELMTKGLESRNERFWNKEKALEIIERIIDIVEFALKVGLPVRFN